MSTPPARSGTWGRRLEVTGWALGTVAGVVLSVGDALERDWWRLAATVVVTALFARRLLRAVGPGSAARRGGEAHRRREAEEARRAMTPARVRALAEQHRLDPGTSAGRAELVRALRAADPRLGLLDATALVDGLGR
ncbi:hypothetical protein [Kineococcus aurantiacus]|uniref:Uncharacterized protein n=1 Tax=Kineococcus aurantiacus TaxID=37633 RepID=A0A7Y9J0U4_9ACTN|nr:hypothetical protein [Kineococcus aurantiacus]NYD22581.1 hypothetical protein [Kineococcus aurantiacus]